MSLGDFGSRFKQARQKDSPQQNDKPYDHAQSYALRSKILGVLLRDARIAAARTQEDCARLLGVTAELVEAWEVGDSVPDLAQLELLAYYLDVPISHFWGSDLLNSDPSAKADAQQAFMELRHRMVGALLRQAREAVPLTLEDVAEQVQIDVATLTRYELGEEPIPMNVLFVLSTVVKKNMDYFIETSGYIGELLRIREEWKRFTGLDEDVRQFAANPLNIGFMRIAMMFSQMPAETLRKVAEGMLDITM